MFAWGKAERSSEGKLIQPLHLEYGGLIPNKTNPWDGLIARLLFSSQLDELICAY